MKTPMQTIRERKQVLEAELQGQMSPISDMVSDFVKDTGLSVTRVVFTSIEVTTIGSGHPEHLISGVEVWYGE